MGRIFPPCSIPVYPRRHLDATLSSIVIPRRWGVIISYFHNQSLLCLDGGLRWFGGHLKEKDFFPRGLDIFSFFSLS